jgi:glycosyltransferase involved in cell wall biosynthesis
MTILAAMKVSVVIPAFNEERLLGESLRHIRSAMAALSGRGWETELIVCDNNSTDRTAEIARAAGARVVFEPVNQIARARNTGAAAATGDWLIFVDADSHPTRELFEDVAEAMAGGRCLAGGVIVRMETPSRAARWVAALWNWLSRLRRLMAGSFIFVDAGAFREVGGFSHELFAGEELDLSVKLQAAAKRRGKRIVILHRHPLLTSDRKLHLYDRRELLRFFLRAAFSRKRVLRSREECHPWYDGRR